MKVTKAFELVIDKPCNQDFDTMPRTSCGVYCNKCQKEVIDFTALTDIELIDILKKKPDTCGMYRDDQVNKFYQFDEIIPERRPFRLWMSILTFISLLGFKEADGQVKNKAPQQTTASSGKNIPKNERVYGRVVDGYNKPLEYVSVTLGDEIATTDANGLFAINNPFSVNKTEATLHFQYNGETMEQQLYAADVRDVAVTFRFNLPLINNFSKGDIKQAPTRDLSKLVAAGAGKVTSGGRGSINAGGSRGGNTITMLDGVMIRGAVPQIPVAGQATQKKEGFFRRLFGKKAK